MIYVGRVCLGSIEWIVRCGKYSLLRVDVKLDDGDAPIAFTPAAGALGFDQGVGLEVVPEF